MIVVDEKSTELLHGERASTDLERSAGGALAVSSGSGSAVAKPPKPTGGRLSNLGYSLGKNLFGIILGVAVISGVAAVGAMALAAMQASQNSSLMRIYAQNISSAVDFNGAELPGSTEVSGEFSDLTGGTVELKDPETGKIVGSASVAGEPTYGDAARSFEIHGTLDDYQVDFEISKSSPVTYHFDPDTLAVTKTTESEGL